MTSPNLTNEDVHVIATFAADQSVPIRAILRYEPDGGTYCFLSRRDDFTVSPVFGITRAKGGQVVVASLWRARPDWQKVRNNSTIEEALNAVQRTFEEVCRTENAEDPDMKSGRLD